MEAVYTIEVTSDGINETLEIHNYNQESWKEGKNPYQNLVETAAKSFVATDHRNEKPEVNQRITGINYYNIQRISSLNDLGLKYQYNFEVDDYEYSTIVFSNTKKFNYKINRNNIIIDNAKDLSSFITYPKLDKITIKLITDCQVNSNNADEIKEDGYYWYFDRDNYQNKSINLEINKSQKEEKLKIFQMDDNGYFGKDTLIVVYIFLGIVLLIGGTIIFFKIKNSNR